MKKLWLKIPAALRWPVAAFIVILIVLVLWQYGARITNGISRAIFRGKNSVITADLQKQLDDGKAAKEVANKAIADLADKKKELAHEFHDSSPDAQNLNSSRLLHSRPMTKAVTQGEDQRPSRTFLKKLYATLKTLSDGISLETFNKAV